MLLDRDNFAGYQSISQEEDKDTNNDAMTSIDVENDENVFFQIFTKISLLSWPIALSYTFSFEVFLTTFMLTYLNSDDEKELAAITLIATMMNTLILLSISPLLGMSVLASEEIGKLELAERNNTEQQKLTEMRDYIAGINRMGLYISGLMAPPTIAALYFSKSILTNIFEQDEQTSAYAQKFLRPYSLAAPAVLARMCSEQMMFSFKHAKAAMVLGLISLTIGTAIASTLSIDEESEHSFNARGVAIGFVFEAALIALLYGLYIARHKQFKDFKFFDFNQIRKEDYQQLVKLCETGAPIVLSVASELGTSLSMGVLAGWVGTREQAALTSAMQCVFFSFILILAFGQVCMQEVSRNIGAENYELASKTGKYGLSISLGYIAIFPALCAIDPRLLTLGISTNQENTLGILKYLMPIISVGIIADIVRYNVLQQLRGLGDSKMASAISIAGLSTGVAISAGLGLKTSLGIYGVGAGYTTGITLTGAVLFSRWQKKIEPENIRYSKSPAAQQVLPGNCLWGFFGAAKRTTRAELELISSADEPTPLLPNRRHSLTPRSGSGT
jgi:multidrug resistance protein, MATE family